MSKTTPRWSSHSYDHPCRMHILYGPVSLWNILSVNLSLQDEVAYRDVDYHTGRLHNSDNLDLFIYLFDWDIVESTLKPNRTACTSDKGRPQASSMKLDYN